MGVEKYEQKEEQQKDFANFTKIMQLSNDKLQQFVDKEKGVITISSTEIMGIYEEVKKEITLEPFECFVKRAYLEAIHSVFLSEKESKT